jgi:hypothetical protein
VLQLVEHLEKVLEASAEPVESPHGHEVELSATGGLHQAVERRSGGRRAGHAVIDVLGNDVPSSLAGDLARSSSSCKPTSWPWPVVLTRA